MASDFNQTQRLPSQDDASAQFNFGVMYYQSEGVRQNYAKAVKWYQKSAKQGYALAQQNLGVMYSKGKGVRQNRATAKEWFGNSCDNGNQNGCDAYRQLNE